MGVFASKPDLVTPAPQPENNTTCRLLSIPPELRVKIYKEVLEPNESYPRGDGSNTVKAEIKEPALLAVCRLIRQEAEPIFYDGLKLAIDRNNLFEPVRNSMRSLNQISEYQLLQIRHFDIPFGGKMTISINISQLCKQDSLPEPVHSGLAQAPGLHVLTTSAQPLCTTDICNAMALSVRDFLLCLIVHRARTKICGSIGPCRAVKMKASAIEKETKKKGVQLKYMERRELEWLLEHLRFDGKQVLREGGLLRL